MLHTSAKRARDHVVEGDEQENPEYEGSTFGGFGEYFRNKQIKLDTQAKEYNAQQSTIFKDCVVYINGYTKPSSATLKRLIVANGGAICSFFGGKSYATHVVAESLTKRKMEMYANWKVVKPAWVVDSVEQEKLLDWSRYRTISLALHFPGTVETGAENGAPNAAEQEQREYILKERQRVNCLAPDFISSYYARSRLHFLSAAKARLRKEAHQRVSQSQNLAPPRVILHVDFDSFFVAVSLLKRPDLEGKPVCVSHGSDSSDVASCNYIARDRGVKNGMWVGGARKVCPDLVCIEYDFPEYTACSNILYEEIISLNPDYLCPVSIDEALVDITRLVGDASAIEELSLGLQKKVRERTGVNVSVGVGPNIYLAKMALRQAKPSGFCYISKDKSLEVLGNCPVGQIPGVGHSISAKLADKDIHTIKDLSRWPLPSLKTNFGVAMGEKLFNNAQGIDSDDISQLNQEPKSVGVEICWGIRLLDEPEVDQFVEDLVTELWTRVDGQPVDTLTIKVYRRAKDAPFVPPKYMGCGKCDIWNKSRQVAGLEFPSFLNIVRSTIKSHQCPSLELRGIGLHLRLKDGADAGIQTMLEPGQRTIETTPTKSPSSRSGKAKVQLQPRRRKGGVKTLSQFLPNQGLGNIDMAVFDTLPTQIKKEILENEDDFHVRVPFDFLLPRREKSTARADYIYYPVKFRTEESEASIRSMITRWIASTRCPNYEDICEFRDYIEGVLGYDRNWIKAVNLVRWLEHKTKTASADWQLFAKIMAETVHHKTVPVSN